MESSQIRDWICAPVLAGRLLSTVPPGESPISFLTLYICFGFFTYQDTPQVSFHTPKSYHTLSSQTSVYIRIAGGCLLNMNILTLQAWGRTQGNLPFCQVLRWCLDQIHFEKAALRPGLSINPFRNISLITVALIHHLEHLQLVWPVVS